MVLTSKLAIIVRYKAGWLVGVIQGGYRPVLVVKYVGLVSGGVRPESDCFQFNGRAVHYLKLVSVKSEKIVGGEISHLK